MRSGDQSPAALTRLVRGPGLVTGRTPLALYQVLECGFEFHDLTPEKSAYLAHSMQDVQRYSPEQYTAFHQANFLPQTAQLFMMPPSLLPPDELSRGLLDNLLLSENLVHIPDDCFLNHIAGSQLHATFDRSFIDRIADKFRSSNVFDHAQDSANRRHYGPLVSGLSF